jgi:Tfp pilus assembly protein PilX
MSAFATLPLAAESVADEGLRIIVVMLIVGLVFLGVIALGQLTRYVSHRRAARKAARQQIY